MTSEVEAVSKAVEEASKATGKAIDASVGLGRFLRDTFGPALTVTGEAAFNEALYWKESRLLVLKNKFEQLHLRYKGTHDAPILPPKFSLPLLEAASEEDDDELTEIFARLLFNAINSPTEVESRRAFVSVLREMSSFDVKVLMSVAAAPAINSGEGWKTVYTQKLPNEFLTRQDRAAGEGIGEPPEAVAISLYNLARLGCVEPGGGWDGVSLVGIVTFTAFGKALVRACTIRPTSSQP